MWHRAGGGLLALLLAVSACAPAAPPPSSAGAPAPVPPGAGAPAATAAGDTTAVATPNSAPAPVSLRYGYSATSIVLLAQKIAVEQGIYRQHGLDVELLLMGAGVMAAAQLAGEVEYTNSYPATIHSAAQGAPLRIVSTIVDAPLFAFVTRPEVQTLADLR